MGGNLNQSTGRGVGPTGAGKGADTGTAAADGAAALDTVEQDPARAGEDADTGTAAAGGAGAVDTVERDPVRAGGGMPHQLRHPDWNQEG